ncbi:MAG TPA: transporter [Candidatus Didemnitutus sp.]|nr:transporter [Candidatus Didemnitutus sp.]
MKLRLPLHCPRAVLLALAATGLAVVARAGPPYVTDDPEPVEYQHWEVYLASATQHTADDLAGTLPHLEVNYGVIPDVQLHLIVPDAFDAPAGEPRHYGLGDIEVGMKYRFVHETDSHPQIGVFPLVELPTGSAARGLGTGHTQLFLPVWIQKSWDKFTAYGGGGYWITPGAGNRNSWFAGWLGQYQLTKSFAPGVEIYYRTAQAVDASPTAQVNVGFVWDLSENLHILASAGPAIHGPHGYQTYLAFQWTFGPEEKNGAK